MRLHLHKVDDAAELVLAADRDLQRHGVAAQTVLHHLHGAKEVRADPVHLVHEREARHIVFVGLAPDGLALRLDTAHGAEQRDGAVQHTDGPLHLHREVHMAGRVDDVDGMVVPRALGGGARDRDAALALLLHPVHLGGAVMHLAHLVRAARVKEDAFGRRGLAGVNVCHDADVS